MNEEVLVLADINERETHEEQQESQRMDVWEFFWGRRPRAEEEEIEEE